MKDVKGKCKWENSTSADIQRYETIKEWTVSCWKYQSFNIFGGGVVVRMSQATVLSYRHTYIDNLLFSITLLQWMLYKRANARQFGFCFERVTTLRAYNKQIE